MYSRQGAVIIIDTTSLFNVGQMHCMTLTPDTEMHIHMRVYVNIVNQPLGTGKQRKLSLDTHLSVDVGQVQSDDCLQSLESILTNSDLLVSGSPPHHGNNQTFH